MALSDNSFCDFTDCAYDETTDTLVCKGGTRFNANYNEATADYDLEVLDTDVTAVFTVKDDDTLTCEDSLGMLKDVVFLRLEAAEAELAAAEAGK